MDDYEHNDNDVECPPAAEPVVPTPTLREKVERHWKRWYPLIPYPIAAYALARRSDRAMWLAVFAMLAVKPGERYVTLTGVTISSSGIGVVIK